MFNFGIFLGQEGDFCRLELMSVDVRLMMTVDWCGTLHHACHEFSTWSHSTVQPLGKLPNGLCIFIKINTILFADTRSLISFVRHFDHFHWN